MAETFRLPPQVVTALRDDNLLLRPMLSADAEALWQAGQDEAIGLYTSIAWPFTLDAAHQLIADATLAWDSGSAARFAIIDEIEPASPLFAGTASLLHIFPDQLDAEVGYWLSPAARGRGLARRAVTLVTRWSFDTLGIQRLHLGVDFPNTASHTVATANGFTPCGEEMWRHPTDSSKDAVIQMYERLASPAD